MMNFLRSMAGRVFLILLVGVLSAAALTWWLAFGERQRTFAQVRDARAVELIEQAIVTLDGLSTAERRGHLYRVSRFGLRFELLDGNPVLQKTADLGPLGQALASRLGNEYELVALQSTPESCPPRMRANGNHAPHGGGWMAGPPLPPRGNCEVVAVKLRDASVVRVAILPPRSPAPPLPPDLPIYIALFLACIAGLVLAVARMTVRPLRQLASAARALGEDVHRPPLAEEGATEIRQATAAFNAMQARIRQQMQQRTEMLAAITHDLQTPLTRLRLRLEKVDDAALREKLIEDLGATQAMVREGLTLARSMDSSEPMQALDLDSLLDSVCADATDAGQDVELAGSSRMAVRSRPTALRRCLTNLLDNAVKYGGYARVQVEARGSQAVIRIRDGGPGIPEDQQEKVFEPFFRLESSRSRETGGTGLGLTIARNIAEQHGGTLTLANRAKGGLEVTLTLPGQRSKAG